MTASIALENITVLREGKAILQDISWTVLPGEHWFVLGANGSGKSTLLELLLGYNWASKGTVKVWGHAFGETYLPDIRKRIGYVAPWIYEHVSGDSTVLEIVAAARDGCLQLFSPLNAEAEKASRAVLKLLEAEHLRQRIFSTLSSGEKLKTVIARALMSGPEILILDEPYASLDLGARHHLQELLEKLAARAEIKNMILVTHHLEEITPLFTHGLLLKEGRAAARGRKEEVLTGESISRAFDIQAEVRKINQQYFII